MPFKRRFNFKRAKWEKFAEELDQNLNELEPKPDNYDIFVNIVKEISRKHIPRGCRTQYVPGLSHKSQTSFIKYKELYEADPFSEDTIEAGEDLLQQISISRAEKWCDLIESLDMKQNSRRAWKLLKTLKQDKTLPIDQRGTISANQIAHQLLVNGKTDKKPPLIKIKRDMANENHTLNDPFTPGELDSAIGTMKVNKSAGLDDIRTEQIKQFGPKTRVWLLNFMNKCVEDLQIPKLWRKSRVVALLKPGKEPTEAKNFRPISLLFHLYKILERMVLNRISLLVDEALIPQQTGFRPGKSCCSQVLNLTQHIEDGFERKEISGVAFVDLSAAYDTVNHKRLISKVYQVTKDYKFTKFIECVIQEDFMLH